MINWSKLVGNKKSGAHYHETMQEVFIVISGKVDLRVGNKETVLEPGDIAFIDLVEIHQFWNVGDEESEYLAIGIASGRARTMLIDRKM